MKNQPSPNAGRNLRETLTTAMNIRVQREIEDVITALPPGVSEEVREAIRQEVLPNSRFILDSLDLQELENENAQDRHVIGVVASASYLVNRIAAQRSRS
jgi:hypothetical protein